MVYNFRVFKKQSPNGKITMYLGKRDFVDHISGIEPIGTHLEIKTFYFYMYNVFCQMVFS